MACCHNVLGVILGFTVHWHCLGAGCTDNTEMVPPVPCGVTMLTNWPIIPIFHLSPSFSYLNRCKWHFTTFPNSCLEISYLKSGSVGHHYIDYPSFIILTVVPPTAKAKKSVSDVMVMAAPALRIVIPNLSVIGFFSSSSLRLLKHCIVTNMSSIPKHYKTFAFLYCVNK